MNMYKKEALNSQKIIKELDQPEKRINLTDEQYFNYWHLLNAEYRYFLKCLYKYLNRYEGLKSTEWGFKTDNYLLLLNIIAEALKIGDESGYYNNKISRKIKDLDMTYYNLNQKDFLREF